jgi:enediyne biosynthesis protein E4
MKMESARNCLPNQLSWFRNGVLMRVALNLLVHRSCPSSISIARLHLRRISFGLVICVAAGLPPTYCTAQSSDGGMQTNGMGGSNTGAPHAAVLDAEHRPITAGGFVKTGPVLFKDIAQQAGLTTWKHVMGTPQKQFIIEANGSGVGLLDYDNDGWLDIYLVSGSTYDAMSGKVTSPKAALFHNNHDGTFTNVAEQAGVTNDRWGTGVAIGDFDNDGWPDIYVSNFGKNRLYHNNHDGTFTDVAEKAGVTLGNWSTGATWGDYDGDGKLDLFVPGYVHYDMANPPAAGSKVVGYNSCQFRGVNVMCGPRGLKGEPDHLFHNNGDGTFTDVSVKAGVSDKNAYYGMSSVFIDVNNDGKPDLLVTNDSTPNYLYINKGDGTFEDDSYASGYALNEDGRETASMGLAMGDYRNNGLIDLYNTVFSDDYNPLYRNDGNGNFTDVSYEIGIAEPTVPFLGWGTAFFDYDNDGWKDLIMANGHVYPVADQVNWGTTWAERPLLFHNVGGTRFDLMPAVEGTALAKIYAGRGLAVGDLFNDGKLDVVINVIDSAPALLRNISPDKNHWIEFKLVGGPKSPRDAVGATVYLTANKVRQRGDVISGGSYESSSDQRIHFGLGDSTAIDSVEVHWPSGAKERFSAPNVDRIITLAEGTGVKF